jgi:PPP family 3-phenylpropionic acid transporter
MDKRPFQRPRIGRASLWISCSYFWYFASIGCFVPYIALYYRLLNLNGWQIGVLSAILPLGVAFIAPLWGALADTFSAHRLIMRSALLLAAATVILVAQARDFVVLLLLMVILSACLAAIPALIDSYAVTVGAREGASFGQLRVWGSVGFIAAVWFVAWWMGPQVSTFFLLAYAASLALSCCATFGLPPLETRSAQRMWHGVAAILSDRSVLLLLLTVYLIVSNATVIGSYLSIYLTEIGGTVQLVGTASVIGAASELPVMVFGRRLLDRFSSRNIFVLAVAVYLLRLGLYSIPPALSWVVFVQLLHGMSFGLYLMAAVTLMHELAGRERAATAQALFSSTALGFGAITGSLVGGALLDPIGAVGIFRVSTVGMLLALAVCIFGVRAAARSVAEQKSQASRK